MSVLKVNCISRSEYEPDGRVSGLGGETFYHTAEQAMDAIQNRIHQYWTDVDGESVWLEVGYQPDGQAYLKTEKDDFPPKSLLSLEECQFTVGEETNSDADLVGPMTRDDGGRDDTAYMAERLALRTIIRMLVLNRYGRDEARLERNRDQAIRRVCGAVDNMDIDEAARERLNEALVRELQFYFAPPPKPQTPS
jgi:hypothetical protein